MRTCIPLLTPIVLAACSAAQIQSGPAVVAEAPPTATATVPATTTVPPSPTPSLTATATVTPSPIATLTATSTPTPPCPADVGTASEYRIPSTRLNYRFRARVYLPPCYAERPALAYPALYLLHGLGQTEHTWEEIGVRAAADALIATGGAPPFIIVMPREGRDERFGEAVVADLIPFVDANFRTISDRTYRALGGISRGGGWAVRIGLQHPDLFSAIGLHSLAIFYEDETKVSGWLDGLPGELLPRLYLDIGAGDGQIVSAAYLDAALTVRNIAHEYRVQPGGHSQRYWSEHVHEYLRWYTAGWGSAPLAREVLAPTGVHAGTVPDCPAPVCAATPHTRRE